MKHFFCFFINHFTVINIKCKLPQPSSTCMNWEAMELEKEILKSVQNQSTEKQSCHWEQVLINSRKFNQQLWRKIFYTLLNIPSCEEIPDLPALRRECEEYFVSSLLPTYNKQINKVILKLDSLASKWTTLKVIYIVCITNKSTKSIKVYIYIVSITNNSTVIKTLVSMAS